MNMPKFTAEDSLYKTCGYYQTARHRINSSSQINSKIYTAIVGHEVIKVKGEAPVAPVRMWEWWGGLEGQPGGLPMPPEPPVGGGGGGVGFPVSIPPDIVTDCLGIGGKLGEKYCGGLGGPSSCKSCAQTLCQQKKCKETGRCDPNELNTAKIKYCDVGCSDLPGCKDGLMEKRSVAIGGFGGIFANS